MPLGSLLVGAISQRIGAPLTVLCQGVLALVIAVAFAKYLLSRPIKNITKEAIDEEIAEEPSV